MRRNIKKIFMMAGVVAMIAGLTGCGTKESTGNT